MWRARRGADPHVRNPVLAERRVVSRMVRARVLRTIGMGVEGAERVGAKGGGSWRGEGRMKVREMGPAAGERRASRSARERAERTRNQNAQQ